MLKTILTTKFYIPPARTDLLPRTRLIEQLNEGAARQLTLVSATAGFGKTTLLSQWIASSNYPVAWLSLDQSDNDTERFLTYLILALKQIQDEIAANTLEILISSQNPNFELILTNLINEIAVTKTHFSLVLDDYHIVTEKQVHHWLSFLLENLPKPMHLVIATRSDPPFPISRLRVRGQLIEIRQADLRFTPEETAVYLNEILDLNLKHDQVMILERRTEGWIAGLQLAGLSIQGNDDLENFLQSFGGSHRFVFDYLVEEVFDRQTANTQLFLLQTSILDKFNASLCNAITGQTDSDRVIRELEATNLFLLPLDDQREWYRYHHLFQDFLRIRLEKQEQLNLHLKAVEWFMSNGFAPEAVKHALASGVTETIVQVITQASVEAFNQGAFQSVLGWLDNLPEAVLCSHTELAVIKGVSCFLLRSAEEARPYIQAAGKNRIQSAPVTIQGQYFYAKALLAFCDNQLNSCIEFAKNALDYLGEDQPVLRNFTMNVLGEVLDIKGEAESAAEYYLQAFDAGWRSGDYLGALVLFTNLILTLNELGRRCEADDRCKRLAESIELQSAPESSLLNSIYLSWSLLKYEENQLEFAREHVLKALNLLKAANFPQGIIWGQYILAQVYMAEGKFDLLRNISKEGQKLASQMGRVEGRGIWFTALEVQADLIEGNLSSALHWVEKTGLSYQDVPNRWNEYVYFTYVKILLAQERFTEAEVLLKTMEQSILATNRNRKMITVNILYSQLLAAQSRHEEAKSRMADAVILAAPQDYTQAFLSEGKNILSLLTQVHFTVPTFVGSLLLTLQSSPDSASQIPGSYESLTEREQEILQLVSKGFSNREIASGLFISLGTVKKHLNNIFSKLDVKNRTQAVNRGIELGLFS